MNGADRLERLLTRLLVPLKRWAESESPRPRRAEVQELVRVAEEARQEAVALQGEPVRTSIPQWMRDEVVRRAKGCCEICGNPFTATDQPEVDHIVPVARFGVTQIDNLQAAHGSCNRHKSARKAS